MVGTLLVVEVELKRPISPSEVPAIVEAVTAKVPAAGPEAVAVSGRLPVWLFAALVHEFHPRPWVATYDPRLPGYVVVASHISGISVGDVAVEKGEFCRVNAGKYYIIRRRVVWE